MSTKKDDKKSSTTTGKSGKADGKKEENKTGAGAGATTTTQSPPPPTPETEKGNGGEASNGTTNTVADEKTGGNAAAGNVKSETKKSDTAKTENKNEEADKEKGTVVQEPKPQKPSMGRIIILKTTEKQRVGMNEHGLIRAELPAIIVAVNEDGTVNLKVFTDGEKDLWVSDVREGAAEGTWSWPARN